MPLTPDEINELAKAPVETTTDGITVKERSADDVIKLDQHQRQQAAQATKRTKNPFKLLRTVCLNPPGSV